MIWRMKLCMLIKVGLQYLITYHEAEFEVLDGYYFDSGRNNKINDVIKDSYDLRKKLKKYEPSTNGY